MPNELIERWFSLLDPDRLARGLWWNEALSLVSGCTPESPACINCWSAAEAHMRGAQSNPKMQERYGGLTDSKGKWTGEVRFMECDLQKPLSRKKPTVYAVWTDLFHPWVTGWQQDEFYAMAAMCEQHVFVVLTKRPEIMAEYMAPMMEPPSNVVHGTTVESQKYDYRIRYLLRTPSAARFVSQEPALGMVDFHLGDSRQDIQWRRMNGGSYVRTFIDLIITGGESGPGARPMHPDIPRSTRGQCSAAGVAYLHKQNGMFLPFQVATCMEGMPLNGEIVNVESPLRPGDDHPGSTEMIRVGKKNAGRLLDGVLHDGG